VIPRETIISGGSPKCNECGVAPPMEVLYSNAGYYIGTMCNCGPYSRESGYFPTYQTAKDALDSHNWETR
jgi:hypothetical protein